MNKESDLNLNLNLLALLLRIIVYYFKGMYEGLCAGFILYFSIVLYCIIMMK